MRAFGGSPRRNTARLLARFFRKLRLEALEDRTAPSATQDTTYVTIDYGSYASRDILVQFWDTSKDWTGQSLQQGTTIVQKYDVSPGLYKVQLSEYVSVSDAIQGYLWDYRVATAEPDYYLTTASVPNDSQYSQQWALGNSGNGIDAQDAWNTTTGSRKTIVAVMDTGADYNHQDLYENIWINQAEIPASRMKNLIDVDGDGLITFVDLNDPRNQGKGKITDVNGDGRIDAADILSPMQKDSSGNDTGYGGWADGVSEDGSGYVDDLVGWNFVANNNQPYDDNGHGTHVSGIIGAQGNNSVGVAGVDWSVSLMELKFMDSSGHGSISSYVNALNFAVKHGAKISNNSWAGGATSALFDALNSARNQGVIIIAAAGNYGANSDSSPVYPADYNLDNIISVAATDSSGNLPSWSDYGANSVDLAAPGVDILSTLPNNSYGTESGTSMATPFVTGVVALVWTQHPTWSYSQVIKQVLGSVDTSSALQGKTVTGGRLDAAKAVGATNTSSDKTAPSVASITTSGSSSNSVNKIVVTFNESIDPYSVSTGAVTLTDPSGKAITIKSITPESGTNNTKWDITFAEQTTTGSYTLKLGTAIKDLAGNKLSAYTGTFTIGSSYTYSNTTKTAIPDQGKTSSSINVNLDGTVYSITVTVNISHTYDSDLYIHLQAPDGTDITLVYRSGGSGDNYTNTTFDDNAKQSIRTGTAPFSGSYQPLSQLSNFKGHSAKGTWKLWVEDLSAGDTGTLNSWSITITTSSGTTTVQSASVDQSSTGSTASTSTTSSGSTGTTTSSSTGATTASTGSGGSQPNSGGSGGSQYTTRGDHSTTPSTARQLTSSSGNTASDQSTTTHSGTTSGTGTTTAASVQDTTVVRDNRSAQTGSSGSSSGSTSTDTNDIDNV
jgi:subtilisin family serine protease/subtilisin-like proprotein convertase family protein